MEQPVNSKQKHSDDELWTREYHGYARDKDNELETVDSISEVLSLGSQFVDSDICYLDNGLTRWMSIPPP